MQNNRLFFIKIKSTLSLILIFFFSISFCLSQTKSENSPPNILFIISDDVGVDVTNGYHQGNLMPNTPTLDSLRDAGVLFDNVWATPKCTPTRAAIMSGKYGVKTGVTRSPGNLDLTHTSLFKALAEGTNNQYADALIGKWHISSPQDPDAPHDHGADYFMGVMAADVDDYYAWDKTQNGTTELENSYVTRTLTDSAIHWINQQEQPWLMWLAHVAPHAPFHEPPQDLYTIPATGSNFRKYIAMLESVDSEINRLLNAMPAEVRSNTIIIYLGDNGTPSGFVQDYPAGRGKSTLYQGGIRVPLFISGPGINRIGEREKSLVHVADLYATILEMAGVDIGNGIHNSLSFYHMLKNGAGPSRTYNYTELTAEPANGWAIRNEQFKLINYANGNQEFFDLTNDSLEIRNLIEIGLNEGQANIKADLEAEAEQIRNSWSCRDKIRNGDEMGVDCGGSACSPCQITDIEEILEENDFLVYPNPSSDYLIIEKKEIDFSGDYTVSISNLLGQTLLITRLMKGNNQIRFDLSHLESQMLIVRITEDQGPNSLGRLQQTFKVNILQE